MSNYATEKQAQILRKAVENIGKRMERNSSLFRMNIYIYETGCGTAVCLAGEIALDADANVHSTKVGAVVAALLGIDLPGIDFSKLFLLNCWPERFKKIYYEDKLKSVTERVECWIKTGE